jgi:hypothetical protein
MGPSTAGLFFSALFFEITPPPPPSPPSPPTCLSFTQWQLVTGVGLPSTTKLLLRVAP